MIKAFSDALLAVPLCLTNICGGDAVCRLRGCWLIVLRSER